MSMFIKSEPVIEEDGDDLLMSYLNSDYLIPTNNLLWNMDQVLLPPCIEPDMLNMPTMFIPQPTSPRSYCSSSSSDSEQPKKRRGRKKREQASTLPPVIAPAPIKPTAPPKPALEAATKRQERLIKNRAAALLSRKRKREHLHNLEEKCNQLEMTNKTLEKRIIELEKENKELKRTESSDHFIVMMICYIVFIVSFSSYMTDLTTHPKLSNSSINRSNIMPSSIPYIKDKKDPWSEKARRRKQFQRLL